MKISAMMKNGVVCVLRSLSLESDMTPNRARTLWCLAAWSVCLWAAGCYTPGGGWTMRAGIDVRILKKPAAFVEMVDTRWDESNRIAEYNMKHGEYFVTSPAVQSPVSTPVTGPHLMEGVPVPATSDPGAGTPVPNPTQPTFPGNSGPGNSGSDNAGNPSADNSAGNATGNSTADEPGRMPAATDSPAKSPLPGLGPVSSRDSLDGSSTGTTQTSATVPANNPPRRPMASRLFARPR